MQQQGMQQQGMQQQAIVPPPAASSSLSRRAGVGINPVSINHTGIPEPRRRRSFGDWFGNLSAFAKLWVALLAVLLIYLIGIVVPVTLFNLFFGGSTASQQIIPISASSSLAAVYSRGSYEVMTYDLEAGQEIALADQQVAPTATYTPFPTPTPAAIAMASSGQQANVAPQSNLQLLQKKHAHLYQRQPIPPSRLHIMLRLHAVKIPMHHQDGLHQLLLRRFLPRGFLPPRLPRLGNLLPLLHQQGPWPVRGILD